MARIRKVTRTIVSTDVEVQTINTATDVIGSVVITVAGTYNVDDEKEAKALDKAVRKSFANQKLGDEIVMVSIMDTPQERSSIRQEAVTARRHQIRRIGKCRGKSDIPSSHTQSAIRASACRGERPQARPHRQAKRQAKHEAARQDTEASRATARNCHARAG